jgi:hypothetical protein
MNVIKIILYFTLIYLVPLNGQSIWTKIMEDPSYRFDNFDMNDKGDIALSLANKYVIIELTERGNKIKEYPYSDKPYNYIYVDKKVLYSHNGDLNIYDFFSRQLLKISRKNSNIYKAYKNIYYIYSYYNDNYNNHYVNDLQSINLYDSLWNLKSELFNSTGIILGMYFYDDLNNYFLYETSNINVAVTKFNRKTYDTQKLFDFPFGTGFAFVVTSDGRLLSSKKGLFSNSKDQRIKIDYRDSSEFKFITFMSYGKDGNLYMRSDEDMYYSKDEGYHWQKLTHLSAKLPKLQTRTLNKVPTFMVYDTSFAALLVNDLTENDGFYYIRAGDKDWQKLDLKFNTRYFNKLDYSKKKNLFASDNELNFIEDKLLKSTDEGKTWEILKYQGRDISYHELINETIYGSSLDSIGRTIGIYSNDEGLTWSRTNVPGLDDRKFYFIYHFKIGKNILAKVGRQESNLTPEDIAYYYLSEDNGNSWKYLYTQGLYTAEDSRKFDLNNNVYYYDWILGIDSLYISRDYGKTKEIDPRFSQFTGCYGLNFNQDGSVFILASKNKEAVKLYKTSNYINFVELDCVWNKIGHNGLILNNNYYPTVLGYDIEHGVWISQDGGHNWIEYNDGLKFLPEAFNLFKHSILLDDRRALLSINYDGLYKTSWPLNTTHFEVKNDKAFLHPNPFQNNLALSKTVDLTFPVQLRISDLHGKHVYSQILNSYDELLQCHAITNGIYLAELIQHNNSIAKQKLVELK